MQVGAPLGDQPPAQLHPCAAHLAHKLCWVVLPQLCVVVAEGHHRQHHVQQQAVQVGLQRLVGLLLLHRRRHKLEAQVGAARREPAAAAGEGREQRKHVLHQLGGGLGLGVSQRGRGDCECMVWESVNASKQSCLLLAVEKLPGSRH